MMMVLRIIIPPPPMPCKQRPPMRTSIELERAASRLPARNRVFAVSRAAFLPVTSDNFAQSGVDAVLARLYAEPTHVYCAEVACKLLAIVGSAVATMVMSKAARNCARQSDSITSLLRVVPIVFLTFSDTPVCTRLSSRSCRTPPRSSVIVGWVLDITAFAEERLDKDRGQRRRGDPSAEHTGQRRGMHDSPCRYEVSRHVNVESRELGRTDISGQLTLARALVWSRHRSEQICPGYPG